MTTDSELLEKFHDDAPLVEALQYLDAVEKEQGVETDDFVEALLQVGHLLHQRENFLDALGYFIRGRGVLEARKEQLHPLMSDLLAGMGENYLLQQMHQEALPYLEKAISVREALCVSDNIETALLLMKTAELNVMNEELFSAHEQLTRAYQILCEVCPDNYEILGEACHNLGVLLIAEKHYDRALECLRRSCEYREKSFGKDSLERSDSLIAYAAASKAADRKKEGLQALYEAISIREEALGSDHDAVKDAKARYRELCDSLDENDSAAQDVAPNGVHGSGQVELVAALASTAILALEQGHREAARSLLELQKKILGREDAASDQDFRRVTDFLSALTRAS